MAQSKGQNVGTPRFYVDLIQYGLTIGEINVDEFGLDGIDDSGGTRLWGQSKQDLAQLFYLNPTKRGVEVSRNYLTNTSSIFSIPTGSPHLAMNYVMILGHNLAISPTSFNIKQVTFENGYYETTGGVQIESGYINHTASAVPSYNGWSLIKVRRAPAETDYLELTLTPMDSDNEVIDDTVRINTISMGQFYDMPHSPDLQLTMTREFDGIKHVTTKGGALLSNINYAHSSNWLREPWGLQEWWSSIDDTLDRRPGRRVWNLKFSYIDHSDVMPDMELINNLGLGSQQEMVNYDLYHTDNTFFSQFMKNTLGGNLRFVFQPDKDNMKPDGFAICILDQKGISIKQVAHQVYDISLKIMEVW